jgi:hypothetical protein
MWRLVSGEYEWALSPAEGRSPDKRITDRGGVGGDYPNAVNGGCRPPSSGGESDQLVADGLVLSMPPSSVRKS